MSNKKTVYWSVDDAKNTGNNWNVLYEDLESVYKSLVKNKNNENGSNFFQCPSFINNTKNIFVFKNPLHSKFKIQDDNVVATSKTHIKSTIEHDASIKNNLLMVYGLHFYFFSEEDLEMSISSPYFQKTDYLQYGAVVPGSFNIGSWFRRIDFEINLWDNVKEIEIKEGEPLAYFSFKTKKRVQLKRFTMNDTLYNIRTTIGNSTLWEPNVSLEKRYKRFKNSKTKELVLREIKKNLL